MTKLLLFLWQLCIVSLASANDGTFFSRGDHIFPIEDSTIILKKERLRMRYVEEAGKLPHLQIDVYFEFLNPDKGKELLVGFVSPGAGDEWVKSFPAPLIDNFTVVVNDTALPFRFESIEKADISNLKESYTGYESKFYVYYFRAFFKPGVNKVYHSYTYYGNYDNSRVSSFSYRLSTGRLWANKEIEDFELIVDLGSGVLCSLPTILDGSGNQVQWEKYGLYKSEVLTEFYGYEFTRERRSKRLFMSAGTAYCVLRQKHFKPIYDFDIRIYDRYRFVCDYADHILNTKEAKAIFSSDYFPYLPVPDNHVPDLGSLSKDQLRLLRNALFAMKGVVFKTEDLNKYFKQFLWYVPNPGITADASLLNASERKLIEQIKSFDK